MTAERAVNFYALNASDEDAQQQFACRLTEKVVRLGHRVHLQVDDPAQLRALDALLWQFRADAFLPHARLDDPDPDALTGVRVTLGCDTRLPPDPDVLINLATQIPGHHAAFQRISDVVPAWQPALDQGRQRYRQYQSLGYTLETFKV